MQKFVLAGVLIFSILIIIGGRFYYNDKLEETAQSAQQQINGTSSESLEDVENEEEVTEETASADNEAEDSGTEQVSDSEMEELAEGLPSTVADIITEKEAAGESVHILMVGSRSSTDFYDQGITPWPVLLQEELNEAYGDGFFQIETMTFGAHSSQEIIDQNAHGALTEAEADILLLEGFNWNDNLAAVPMENARQNLMEMVAAVEQENEDVYVMIQPSAPVYGTSIYPEQIQEFAEYVQSTDHHYVDHWEAWPPVEDEELLNYIDEDNQNMPNQEGHELWKNYLSSWFISE